MKTNILVHNCFILLQSSLTLLVETSNIVHDIVFDIVYDISYNDINSVYDIDIRYRIPITIEDYVIMMALSYVYMVPLITE
jgi:hypothetical protein